MPEGGLARQSAVPGPRDAPGTLSEGGGFLATWAPEQNRRWKPGPGPRPGFPRSLRGSPPSCSEAVGRSRPALKNSHAVGPRVGPVTGRHPPPPSVTARGSRWGSVMCRAGWGNGSRSGTFTLAPQSPGPAPGTLCAWKAAARPGGAWVRARPHTRGRPPTPRQGASGTRRPLDPLPLSAVSSPFSLVLLPKIGHENFPRWL